MSRSHDYCISSSKPAFQLNGAVTITVPMNQKHKMIDIDCEPPAKKQKVHLTRIERVSNRLQNYSTDNLKSVLTANVSTTANSVINKNDSIGEKLKAIRQVSSTACQTENYQLLSILNLTSNARAMKFYTGFKDYDQFLRIFGSLGPDKYDLKYFYNDEPLILTHLDQFLVVLILLKQHKSHYEISIMFNITLKDIKNIFITWIRFMKLEWSRMRIGKAQNLLKKITILNNIVKSNTVPLESNNKDDVQVIVLENDKPNLSDQSRKMYKILLDGPANYIESHLVHDIKFVCERLCYLTLKSNNEHVRLKPLTKKIVQKDAKGAESLNDCLKNVSLQKKVPKVYKKVFQSVSYCDSTPKLF